MRPITDADRSRLIVGRPIPVSLYTADKMLLLAAGRVIPNEFVRDSLLRSGAHCGYEDGANRQPETQSQDAPYDPIAALQADYQHTHDRAPVGFQMEREGHTLTVRIIGVTEDGKGLIMSGAAIHGDASPLRVGEVWTFRALYAIAAIRFNATIGHIESGPFAYFSASNISDIDRRNVRQWPRTPTCIWASRSGEPPRVIVDMSVGGARIGVDERSHLQTGQVILLSVSLNLATGRKELSLDASVQNDYGRADNKHPHVHFYGVRFENPSELDRLILHGYVQEHLSMELDRVWHVLVAPH